MIPFLALICLALSPFLTTADEKFCDELMKGFEPCEKSLAKKYCPYAYSEQCEGGEDEEDGGGGDEGPPPEDDPQVCPKWKKQGKKGYCDPSNTRNMMDYCPATYEKDCVNGGGGGGGEKKEKKPKSKPEPKPKPKPKPQPKPTPAPTTAAATTAAQTTAAQEPEKSAEEQYQDCCKANGVSSPCMKMCSFDRSKSGTALCNPKDACEQFAKIVHHCVNNGGDHTKCCKGKNWSKECLTWCNAKKPLAVDFSKISDLMSQKDCLASDIGRNCAKSEYKGQKEWSKKSFGQGQKFSKLVSGFVSSAPPCA